MLLFIAIWQGIDMGVVEKRVVPVAPREPLSTNSQVIIFHERRPLVGLIFVRQVAVDCAQANRGESHEEGQVLPEFVAP